MHLTTGCCCRLYHLQGCLGVMSINMMPGDRVKTQIRRSSSLDVAVDLLDQVRKGTQQVRTTRTISTARRQCLVEVGGCTTGQVPHSPLPDTRAEHIRNETVWMSAAQHLRIASGTPVTAVGCSVGQVTSASKSLPSVTCRFATQARNADMPALLQ